MSKSLKPTGGRCILIEVAFQGKVLRDENRLPKLFYHMEVIGWIHASLEQNPTVENIVQYSVRMEHAQLPVGKEYHQGGRIRTCWPRT